jgi:hypothetical protein
MLMVKETLDKLVATAITDVLSDDINGVSDGSAAQDNDQRPMASAAI